MTVLLEVCQFHWSFQRAIFCSTAVLHCFSAYNFTAFWSLLFPSFGFILPFFSKFWSRECRLLVWGFSSFLMWAFGFQNFLLSTVPQTLICYMHISSMLLCFSVFFEVSHLTHGLFWSMKFSCQVFGDFPVIFLLFLSSLIPLWSENTLWFQFFDVYWRLFTDVVFLIYFTDTWGEHVRWNILAMSIWYDK